MIPDDIPYRNFLIHHEPPPIPYRGADWQFRHKDYDGPEDGRCGTAPSLEEAKARIDELEENP